MPALATGCVRHHLRQPGDRHRVRERRRHLRHGRRHDRGFHALAERLVLADRRRARHERRAPAHHRAVDPSDGPSGTSLLSAPDASGSITHATIDGNAQLPPSVTVSGSSLAYCAGPAGPTSGGYNQSVSACNTAVATDRVGPAQLAPMDDNGGTTATRLPSAASPLLDAIPAGTAGLCDSSAGAVDQRGLPRRAHGRCDIGSVELQSGLLGPGHAHG